MRATPMPALPAPTSTMRCPASSLLLLPCTRNAPYTPATAVAAVPCTPRTLVELVEAWLHGHPPITGIAGLCSPHWDCLVVLLHGHPPITGIAGLCSPHWDCLVVLQKRVQHADSACRGVLPC